jgi:hypothetical protein
MKKKVKKLTPQEKLDTSRLLKLNRLKSRNTLLEKSNKEQERIITLLDSQLAEVISLKDGLRKLSTTVIDLSQVPPSGLQREGLSLAMISDIHCDEVVSLSRTLGLNRYNPDIAKKRIANFFYLTLKEINRWRKELIVDELHLLINGDLTSGNIHYALIETNSMPPINAMLFAQEQLVQGIKYLSEKGNFKKLKVICLTGNHPRITPKLTDKTRTGNSLEYYAYKVMEDLFTNILVGYDNVEFIVAEGSLVQVKTQYGKTYLVTHGDQIRYLGGVGGVMIPTMRWWLNVTKTFPADKAFIGHHHHWIPQNDITINGSVIGYNEYAMHKGFQFQPPIQHLELLDSKYGFTKKVPLILG